jgi:hypothetical protein
VLMRAEGSGGADAACWAEDDDGWCGHFVSRRYEYDFAGVMSEMMMLMMIVMMMLGMSIRLFILTSTSVSSSGRYIDYEYVGLCNVRPPGASVACGTSTSYSPS